MVYKNCLKSHCKTFFDVCMSTTVFSRKVVAWDFLEDSSFKSFIKIESKQKSRSPFLFKQHQTSHQHLYWNMTAPWIFLGVYPERETNILVESVACRVRKLTQNLCAWLSFGTQSPHRNHDVIQVQLGSSPNFTSNIKQI